MFLVSDLAVSFAADTSRILFLDFGSRRQNIYVLGWCVLLILRNFNTFLGDVIKYSHLWNKYMSCCGSLLYLTLHFREYVILYSTSSNEYYFAVSADQDFIIAINMIQI